MSDNSIEDHNINDDDDHLPVVPNFDPPRKIRRVEIACAGGPGQANIGYSGNLPNFLEDSYSQELVLQFNINNEIAEGTETTQQITVPTNQGPATQSPELGNEHLPLIENDGNLILEINTSDDANHGPNEGAVAVVNDSQEQDSCSIDSDDLNFINDYCENGVEKSPEALLKDYLNDPSTKQSRDEFYYHDISRYLMSKGDHVNSCAGFTVLLSRIKAGEYNTILVEGNITAAAATQFKEEGSMNYSSVNTSGSRAQCNVAQGFDQQKQNDQPMETDQKFLSVQPGPSRDAFHQPQMEKVNFDQESLTEALFIDIRAEYAHESEDDKIKLIGRKLFNIAFSDDEKVGCCKRKQKDKPAFDKKKVFLIKQVVAFFVDENDDFSVANFKAKQGNNNGLRDKRNCRFEKTVMIDHANTQRHDIREKRKAEADATQQK